jgi:hypothetical protein
MSDAVRFDAANVGYVGGAFGQGDPANFDVTDLDTEDRSHYGRVLIWGYLVLVALVSVLPLLVWAALASDGAEFDKGLPNIQNLIVALLAGLSGVAGLAGLVAGRYFGAKAETTSRKGRRSGRRSKH